MPTEAEWVAYFQELKIPKEYIQTYAKNFTQHRISEEMLPKLDKEYLNDLGVKSVGDVLTILKHSGTPIPAIPSIPQVSPYYGVFCLRGKIIS